MVIDLTQDSESEEQVSLLIIPYLLHLSTASSEHSAYCFVVFPGSSRGYLQLSRFFLCFSLLVYLFFNFYLFSLMALSIINVIFTYPLLIFFCLGQFVWSSLPSPHASLFLFSTKISFASSELD